MGEDGPFDALGAIGTNTSDTDHKIEFVTHYSIKIEQSFSVGISLVPLHLTSLRNPAMSSW
jgi:hypothetical protein